MITIAVVIAACGHVPHHEALTEWCANAVHELVCSVPPNRRIADNDPALPIFWDKGESIDDAKVDLADERDNSCDDPKESQK